MVYTVGEMAKKLDVPASTLRYYDKEGLLPFVERSSGGIRMFQESDFEWLQVIGCMKKAGMSIRDIRQYIELALRGDDTIDTRLKMFTHQRDVLLAQMEEMRHTLETVEYKCWYYETAKASGTIDVPRDMADEGARALPRHPARTQDDSAGVKVNYFSAGKQEKDKNRKVNYGSDQEEFWLWLHAPADDRRRGGYRADQADGGRVFRRRLQLF